MNLHLHLHLPSHSHHGHGQGQVRLGNNNKVFVCLSEILKVRPVISVCSINIFRGLALKRKNKNKNKHFQPCSYNLPISASLSHLDLTEENIKKVLLDSRTELAQLYDSSVGITGKAELAELDGPYVKISLSGRFWHQRTLVLARLANYLKHRIPEILEVDIEDEKQLDDSPLNF